MDHAIKINRSRALAPMLPQAQASIEADIPAAIIERLTGSELAIMRQAMDAHWHNAVAYAEQSVLAEGAIWDAAHGRMLEVQ